MARLGFLALQLVLDSGGLSLLLVVSVFGRNGGNQK